jgi:hypothetical protein
MRLAARAKTIVLISLTVGASGNDDSTAAAVASPGSGTGAGAAGAGADALAAAVVSALLPPKAGNSSAFPDLEPFPAFLAEARAVAPLFASIATASNTLPPVVAVSSKLAASPPAVIH